MSNDAILLSVPEACRRLSIKKSLFWLLLERGEIASIRIGRRRLIPARALDEFAERLAEEQAAESAGVPR